RSRPALRDAAERRASCVQLCRPGHDGRDVSDRAGARRRDVRARGVRPDGDGDHRGEEMKRLRRGWLALAAATLALAALAVWLRCGPIPQALLEGVNTPSTVVLDRHGRVLYEALGSDGTRVRQLDARTLPPLLASATVAAEDRRFYSHAGVDP